MPGLLDTRFSSGFPEAGMAVTAATCCQAGLSGTAMAVWGTGGVGREERAAPAPLHLTTRPLLCVPQHPHPAPRCPHSFTRLSPAHHLRPLAQQDEASEHQSTYHLAATLQIPRKEQQDMSIVFAKVRASHKLKHMLQGDSARAGRTPCIVPCRLPPAAQGEGTRPTQSLAPRQQ